MAKIYERGTTAAALHHKGITSLNATLFGIWPHLAYLHQKCVIIFFQKRKEWVIKQDVNSLVLCSYGNSTFFLLHKCLFFSYAYFVQLKIKVKNTCIYLLIKKWTPIQINNLLLFIYYSLPLFILLLHNFLLKCHKI